MSTRIAQVEPLILTSYQTPYSGFAAVRLAQLLKLPRVEIDRALRRLSRRGLIQHRGAWELTSLGKIAAEKICPVCLETRPEPESLCILRVSGQAKPRSPCMYSREANERLSAFLHAKAEERA